MICKRCQQEKPQIEFNNWIRYQRPIREPFSEYCVDCVWTQASHQVNWISCLERVLWRSQFVTEKDMIKFAPYSIDDILRPLIEWAYGIVHDDN